VDKPFGSYKSVVNRWRLPLLCEKTGAGHSTSATGSYDRLAGKIVLNSEILKLYIRRNIRIFLTFDKGTLYCYNNCTNAFQSIKILRWYIKT